MCRVLRVGNLNQELCAQGGTLPREVRNSVMAAKAPPEPRRVAIAYETAEAGRTMAAWAVKTCLYPDDDVYMLHISPKARVTDAGSEHGAVAEHALQCL